MKRLFAAALCVLLFALLASPVCLAQVDATSVPVAIKNAEREGDTFTLRVQPGTTEVNLSAVLTLAEGYTVSTFTLRQNGTRVPVVGDTLSVLRDGENRYLLVASDSAGTETEYVLNLYRLARFTVQMKDGDTLLQSLVFTEGEDVKLPAYTLANGRTVTRWKTAEGETLGPFVAASDLIVYPAAYAVPTAAIVLPIVGGVLVALAVLCGIATHREKVAKKAALQKTHTRNKK